MGVGVEATWFSGTFQGVSYDNVLVLGTEVSETIGGVSSYESDLDRLFLEGLDPATTQIDLKAVVDGGGLDITSFYRINSDLEEDWTQISSLMLPDGVGPANGFPDQFPAVWLSAESVVPLPAAVWLFGSGLLGLIGVSKWKRTK